MDQRRSLRIPVDLPARFRSPTRSIDGRARNLSQGGMLFVVPDPVDAPAAASPPPPPDVERVVVEIDMPDEQPPISVAGEVRWIEARGAGIRFTQVAVSARRRLANLILRTCAMLIG